VIVNTILAGNSPGNCSGAITDAGHNLSSDGSCTFPASGSMNNTDPKIGPLGNSGGPTLTMPPLAGSPAIDAGDDSVTNFLSTDQRGYPRLSGTHVDIGAVELQVVSVANAPVLNNPVVQIGGALNFSFASSSNTDFTVLTTTNLALPLADWTILTPAIQGAPGQYQFTDLAATNYPQRFYGVVSP